MVVEYVSCEKKENFICDHVEYNRESHISESDYFCLNDFWINKHHTKIKKDVEL